GDFLNSPQLEETSCLIADVNMPGMTGVELYEFLLKVGRSIPTILITAYPDDRVRTRAIDKGVLAYLVKPFSETDLTRYVRFALESGSPQKCLEPISKSSEEDHEAGELYKAEEVLSVVLPADEDATLPLYPGEEPL